jgi:hypothetical protein
LAHLRNSLCPFGPSLGALRKPGLDGRPPTVDLRRQVPPTFPIDRHRRMYVFSPIGQVSHSD